MKDSSTTTGDMADGSTGPVGSSVERISENITRCGKEYRWIHDVSLWRDTVIPMRLFKITLLAALMPALLLLVIETLEGSFMRGLQAFGQVYAIVAGIMLCLFIIAYQP